MIQRLKHITHEKRCRELGLLNLEKEKAKPSRNPITVFHYQKGEKTQPDSFKKVQCKSQRNCGISILGHFQNSGGQGLEQLDLTLRFTLLWTGGWTRWPPEALSCSDFPKVLLHLKKHCMNHRCTLF